MEEIIMWMPKSAVPVVSNQQEEPPTSFLGKIASGGKDIERKLGEGSWLPGGLGILGGMGAGPIGAGILGSSGKYLQQQAGKEQLGKGIASLSPIGPLLFPEAQSTPEEAKEQLKTGAKMAAFEAVFPYIMKGAGKVVGKVTKPIKDALRPVGQAVSRQVQSQILRPSAGMIKKELTEAGISETLEEAQKRGIKGTAREVFVSAGKMKKSIWKGIKSFLTKNADDLPKIQMDDIVSALDDEIARQTRLNQMSKVDDLVKMKKDFQGEKTFPEAYQLVKDWGEEARNVYKSGKDVIDVKPHKTKAYKLLADTGRAKLKEESTKQGYGVWAKMMDDYHFYANLKEFSSGGVAKGQTPFNLSVRDLSTRTIPWGLSKVQQVPEAAGKVVEGSKKIVNPFLRSLLYPQLSGESPSPQNEQIEQ